MTEKPHSDHAVNSRSGSHEVLSPETVTKWGALVQRLARVTPTAFANQVNAVSGQGYSVIDYPGIARAFGGLAAEMLRKPEKLMEAQADLFERNMSVLRSAFVPPGSDTVQGASRRDRRFQHKDWSEQPFYRFMRDAYLENAEWLAEQVRRAEDLDAHEKDKAMFYTRQLISALSPANFALTNPQVRNLIEDKGAEALLEGFEKFVQDLEKGDGNLEISQTDEAAFEVGGNLATTPGKVVYRNDMIELIQYKATTDEVYEIPFLMVPPWINKFYVLDLQPENSFLKWLVSQGHTVFVISWVNPREEHAGKGFEDYMRKGPLKAIKVVRKITGADEVNLGGFCIGGILSVCMMAYLAQKGDTPIRSATLLATMLDLSEIGECGVFIDEDQVANIEKHSAETGYLDGRHMMNMFSMLRENDLIWNYVVSNYLLGRDPRAFDILYWNADCTRLPARMLTDYLRNIAMENSLIRPGALVLDGVPIDIGKIKTPCYFLSTIDDHIAPWTTTYPAVQMLAGPCEFVLGGSGHIAGIVNPPDKNKYFHRTSAEHPQSREDWLAAASEHQGSWWPHWAAWVAGFGGDRIKARKIGSKKYKALCDAPGTYVLER